MSVTSSSKEDEDDAGFAFVLASGDAMSVTSSSKEDEDEWGGHNFGLTHDEGDYRQKGLMNNENKLIPPTRRNNIDIININVENIQTR